MEVQRYRSFSTEKKKVCKKRTKSQNNGKKVIRQRSKTILGSAIINYFSKGKQSNDCSQSNSTYFESNVDFMHNDFQRDNEFAVEMEMDSLLYSTSVKSGSISSLDEHDEAEQKETKNQPKLSETKDKNDCTLFLQNMFKMWVYLFLAIFKIGLVCLSSFSHTFTLKERDMVYSLGGLYCLLLCVRRVAKTTNYQSIAVKHDRSSLKYF